MRKMAVARDFGGFLREYIGKFFKSLKKREICTFDLKFGFPMGFYIRKSVFGISITILQKYSKRPRNAGGF